MIKMKFILLSFGFFLCNANYLISQTKEDVVSCIEQVFEQQEVVDIIRKKQLHTDVLVIERKFKIRSNARPEEIIATTFEKDDFWNLPIEINLLTLEEQKDLAVPPLQKLNLSFQFDEKKRILVMLSTPLENRPRFFSGQYFFEQKNGNWELINQSHFFQ